MIIYKYLDEDGALATVENKSVLLKTPLEYNDPFDCYFYISDKERRKAFKLFLNYSFFKILYLGLVVQNKATILGNLNTKILKLNLIFSVNTIKKTKKYKWLPDVAFYYTLAKKISGKSEDDFLEEFNTIVDDIINRARQSLLFACFSLKKDSILMWSHYANQHKGACVEFEINDDDFKRVSYKKKPPCFSLTRIFELMLGHEMAGTPLEYEDDTLSFVLKPILTKYIGWKYEKEIRCGYSSSVSNPNISKGKTKKGNDGFFLTMSRIKTIYIGCNSSNGFTDDIKRISNDIPIRKMKKLKNKYGLIDEPLEQQ